MAYSWPNKDFGLAAPCFASASPEEASRRPRDFQTPTALVASEERDDPRLEKKVGCRSESFLTIISLQDNIAVEIILKFKRKHRTVNNSFFAESDGRYSPLKRYGACECRQCDCEGG